MRGSSCLVSTPAGLSPLSSPGWPPAASAGSLGRAPPFFRTSAGHRVEGRNPWHRPCSRNPLRAGTPFRRLGRTLSRRPSELLASWADQPEPVLSLPQAFPAGLPALKAPRGLPAMTTAPNGALRQQDLHLQGQQCVSLRSLPGVLWACVPPLPRDYAPRRLPLCPSRATSLGARAPIPCLFLSVRGVPHGLGIWSTLPHHARAFGHPVPQAGRVTRRPMALPRSRATPAKACPALRPRWCPAYSPSRPQDCCLPATGNRRPSSLYCLENAPVVHDVTLFGARSRGLPPHSIQLRTSIAGCARGWHF
jgi:hypothetical protein